MSEEAAKRITDMEVANIGYDDIFGEQDNEEGSDWQLLNANAIFSHKEACEFIVYIGGEPEDDGTVYSIEMLKDTGYSDTFIDCCVTAREMGYTYACFYA